MSPSCASQRGAWGAATKGRFGRRYEQRARARLRPRTGRWKPVRGPSNRGSQSATLEGEVALSGTPAGPVSDGSMTSPATGTSYDTASKPCG